MLKLNPAQIKTVKLALYLAVEWEKSVLDSISGTYGIPMMDSESIALRRKTLKNIKKMDALRLKLP